MASRKIIKKRKKIISEIIRDTGLTKKAPIINIIRENPQYNKHFEDVAERTIYRLISFDKEEEVLDPGHYIKGRSILKNSAGEIVMEWVKTAEEKEETHRLMLEAKKAMLSDITPYKPIQRSEKKRNLALCNQYTITDYHLGMMAWGEESGNDWDMQIAEKLIIDWFSHAIQNSPDAAHSVFAQIGDFLHWDGLDAVTPASKHVLDADTRFQKLVRVSIRVLRQIINMLLVKYDHVHVIMAEGNHDVASSAWLREMFHAFYQDETRISVDCNPDPYYHFQWGKTCLFYHHGHKKNLKGIDSVFVSKFKSDFGQSEHVYAHTGHLHHEKVLETNLMIVEQHPTLAAKDAYASRGGYMSGRSAKVITYHDKYGEVGRDTISPDMLK